RPPPQHRPWAAAAGACNHDLPRSVHDVRAAAFRSDRDLAAVLDLDAPFGNSDGNAERPGLPLRAQRRPDPLGFFPPAGPLVGDALVALPGAPEDALAAR